MKPKTYFDRLDAVALKARIQEERAMALSTEALHYKLSLDAALARIKEQEISLTLAHAVIAGLRAQLEMVRADPGDTTELTTREEERWLEERAA